MDEYNENPQVAVEKLYESRRNFVVVGLTGLSGCGCSTLASYMADNNFFRNRECVRDPNNLHVSDVVHTNNTDLYHNSEEGINQTALSEEVFKRKYSICYNFLDKGHYQKYRIIKYTRIIWLYILLFAKREVEKDNEHTVTKDDVAWKIDQVLKDKFGPARARQKEPSPDEDYINENGEYSHYDFVPEILKLDGISWDELLSGLAKLDPKEYIDNLDEKGADKKLADFFFGDPFQNFASALNLYLAEKDFYYLCFLYHRLGFVIRSCGSPIENTSNVFQKPTRDTANLYKLVHLINCVIKGTRKRVDGGRAESRIVIDSIRSSFEAFYLRERYSAFYLVAVHDDEHHDKHLKQKITDLYRNSNRHIDDNSHIIESVFDKVKHLCQEEVKNDDFEKGFFYSPNVSQCISDAEIHIANTEGMEPESPSFYTMAEQWMKYAALILHPGLITPSSEERCMVVAYTAKFNSSCLSRQVGAVITNEYHSIRTIGWNEVPYGHIPCGLRDVRELLHDSSNKESSNYKYVYSEYEYGTSKYKISKKTFIQNMYDDLRYLNNVERNLNGLPFPYCFKTMHNRYEDEKNQVHTRSLHAEENAMLQMVKFGGEKLMNGIIYVTASPCELCSKKLYQIGVRKIVYIDPYPGIARQNIIGNGYKRPTLKLFQGAYGATYFKLYQPFISYKDELTNRLGKWKEKEKE
jgi:deoxycytidylate deaminase